MVCEASVDTNLFGKIPDSADQFQMRCEQLSFVRYRQDNFDIHHVSIISFICVCVGGGGGGMQVQCQFVLWTNKDILIEQLFPEDFCRVNVAKVKSFFF